MSGATQPNSGYAPLPTRPFPTKKYVVRVYPEGGIGRTRDYDLTDWPLSAELRDLFADAFERVTKPGGSRRTEASALTFYSNLRRIAYDVAEHGDMIKAPQDFTAFFVTDLSYRRGRGCIEALRLALRGVDGISPLVNRALYAPKRRNGNNLITPYSDSEFRDITREARSQLRRALERIRAGHAALAEWRARQRQDDGHAARYGSLLDIVDRTGDVPRTNAGAVRTSRLRPWNVRDLCTSLFPTQSEATSALVLLIAMTGQNAGTIRTLSLQYLLAGSSIEDDLPVATVCASKPRRGAYRSEMTIQLTNLPAWLGEPKRPDKDRDELDSPYGVFQAALELCAAARRSAGSNALLVYWGTQNMTDDERHRADGSRAPRIRELRADSPSEWIGPHGGRISGKRMDTRRLRRAYLDRHQKPVAHTVATLSNVYLARSTAVVAQSQQIVAEALAMEVSRTRELTQTMIISATDIADAQEDPDAVAIAHQLTTGELSDVLSGKLDTVATACVGHENGPYDPAGSPCSASFLLCLACPNARSEPRHIPTQALTLQVINTRKQELTPANWLAQYGDAHAQLSYLLKAQGAVLEQAAAQSTSEQRALVDALINGELEIR